MWRRSVRSTGFPAGGYYNNIPFFDTIEDARLLHSAVRIARCCVQQSESDAGGSDAAESIKAELMKAESMKAEAVNGA